MGSYDPGTGRFDLVLDMVYTPSVTSSREADLARWRLSFQHASEMLFHATDGQHQIGTVWVLAPFLHGGADVRLITGVGGSQTFGWIGAAGSYIDLEKEERYRPFIVLHELGHYLYDLWDEYCTEDPETDAECLRPGPQGNPLGVCIMEGRHFEGDRFGEGGNGGTLTPGVITDFCVPENHDLGGGGRTPTDTAQHYWHSCSCWSTMRTNYTDLLPPGTHPVPASGPAEIGWTVAVIENRCILMILDEPFHIPPIPEERWRGALAPWLDFVPRGGFVAGILHGDGIKSTGWFSAGKVPDLSGALDLAAGGGSSRFDAVAAAVRMFRAGDPPAPTREIFLVSRSPHDAGPDPVALLPELRRHGIRVHALAVGPDSDAVRLRALAAGTGGRFLRVPAGAADLPAGLLDLLAALHGLGFAGAADGSGSARWMPLPRGAGGDSFVEVEAGTTRARFVAIADPEDAAAPRLLGPGGVDAGAATRRSADGGFTVFDVEDPAPGVWTLQGLYAEGSRAAAILETDGLAIHVSSPSPLCPLGEPIPIRVLVRAGRPLTGVAVRITLVRPDGATVPVTDEPREGPKGIYTGFVRPAERGVHSVLVEVDNRDGSGSFVIPPSDSSGGANAPVAGSPPRFLRRQALQFEVGPARDGEIRAEPAEIHQGETEVVRLRLDGTPWIPGASQLALGPGIEVVEDVAATMHEGAPVLSVTVRDWAQPGPRDAVVATAGLRYEQSALLEIRGEPREPPEGAGERRTTPGIFWRRREGVPPPGDGG